MKIRKRLLASTLAGVLLLSSCATGASSASPAASASPAVSASSASMATSGGDKMGEGKTLLVGVWGAEYEELMREYVIKPFEAETGAKVELILGGSSDRYSKLYAEEANPSMDVAYLNKAQTEQASRDGVLLPVDPEVVTNYENLYDVAKSGDGYGVSLAEVGIMYSTDEFATPPDSWSIFVDTQYAGKTAPYVYPGTQGTAYLAMVTRAIGGNEETDMVATIDKVAAMKPYPIIASGIPELNQSFLDGDVVLAPQMSGYVYTAQDQGIPVDYARPTEGSALGMNCAVIPKNAKNADLAKVFINYHLSQEAQEAYSKRVYDGPTNADVILEEELAARVIYGEEEVAQLVALDNELLTKMEPTWVEEWNRKILE